MPSSHYRKLIERLAQLFPTIEESKLILRYAAITDTGTIAFHNAAELNWMNIVDNLERQKKLEDLLQTAVDKYGDEDLLTYIKAETQVKPYNDAYEVYKIETEPDGTKLKRLVAEGRLKDTLAALDHISNDLSTEFKNNIVILSGRLNSLEKQQANGLIRQEDYDINRNKLSNSINYQIDQIKTEREIKNLINDLRPPAGKEPLDKPTGLNVPPTQELEKVMRGRNDLQPIDWLYQALEASKIVCKVELKDGSAGTGFLIKGGYVMTNHHVICEHFPFTDSCDLACRQSLKCPVRGRVLFNYQGTSNGQNTVTYELDPADTYIVNRALDYALIKIKDKLDNPLSQWGHAEIEMFHSPKENQLVSIIQHPRGQMKKIAMPDTVISVWPEKNHLFYMADTKEGSSGSPVFNQEWKVIALHHAGADKYDGGMAINKAGDRQEANRGILIHAIVEDLKSQGFNI